ncbi:MAG: hypothetical protein RI883_2077 [Bacteroidota bacterium]|jgi:hypothetical protein
MKNICIIPSAILLLIISPFVAKSQNVCLVSSDFQNGEHYMVVWEKPLIITGIDSVFIYRELPSETMFTKIGAQHMSELSFFTDMSSNTIDSARYAITFLYNTGLETARSPWHQGVVLDYSPLGTTAGTLKWSKYKIENQTNEDYILSYNCMMDETGFGAFTSMGYFMNYQISWGDQTYNLHPLAQYYIETSLPTCNITKANINTSRSNIKKQASNAEASVEEQLFQLNIGISPNPADEELQISFDQNLLNAQMIITDASGKIIYKNSVSSTEMNINISNFQKGIYFISVNKNSAMISKTFMKN